MNPTVSNTTHYTYTLQLLEDLHSGTGTGAGDIDALQARDRHGRPVIRASHLRGLIRAAGEELQELKLIEAAELAALLGGAGGQRGALRLTSLYNRDDGCRPSIVWGSSARQENSRRPMEDTLRFVEYVPAGTRFEARLALTDPQLEPLLLRLLKRIDRLGAQRTRGAGLITSTCAPLSVTTSPLPLPSDGSTALRLVLCNLEPLCLPTSGHAGNLIATASFIRGQVLRGALLGWMLQHHGVDTYRRYLTGGIAVGDALPLPDGVFGNVALQAETVPIPLSILTAKPGAAAPTKRHLPWWMEKGAAPDTVDSLAKVYQPPKEKPKRPGQHEYLYRGEQGWERHAPAIGVHLRNQTGDVHVGENRQPQLFSMEEIAENTLFVAEVRFATAKLATDFRQCCGTILNGTDWLPIGREGRPVMVKAAGATPTLANSPDVGDEWTLTLTSDLVARGLGLGFLQDLDIKTLIELCGETVATFPGQEAWQMLGTAESETLHGFNAATGLRRSPAIAIRRGSCWRISGPGSAELARALRQRTALGERQEDGCGRFVINLQPLTLAGAEKVGAGGAVTQLNLMESLHQAAQKLAGDIRHVKPSPSQLQWLRSRALACNEGKQIDALVEEIQTAPDRRPQGGKAWRNFPVEPLKEALAKRPDTTDQRQLIALTVKWALNKPATHNGGAP